MVADADARKVVLKVPEELFANALNVVVRGHGFFFEAVDVAVGGLVIDDAGVVDADADADAPQLHDLVGVVGEDELLLYQGLCLALGLLFAALDGHAGVAGHDDAGWHVDGDDE